MCTHPQIILDNSFNICTHCGEVISHLLTTEEQTYTDKTCNVFKPRYTRECRLNRLLANLRGWQQIPDEVMLECLPFKSDLTGLKIHMKKTKSLRKFFGKLPSIWRNLGNIFHCISRREITLCIYKFREMNRKISFIILVPYLLKQIGLDSLLVFLKKPSKSILKKYDVHM